MPKGYRKNGSKLGFQKGHKINIGRKNKPTQGFQKGHKVLDVWKEISAKVNKKRMKGNKYCLGRIPWNKNTKGIMKAWNKGKRFPEFSGKNNANWKGGKHISNYGYVYIYSPNHPFKDAHNYIRRSRLVMEKIIGRYLLPEERVHHKGTKYPIDDIRNKSDDRPKNLQLFANESEHQKFHNSLKRNQNPHK